MSYSLHLEATARDDLKGAFTEAVQDAPEQSPERTDHLAAVTAAITGLANAVGTERDLIEVTVSGHVNPEHLPREGYADESVTITVRAIPVAASAVDELEELVE